MPTLTSVLDSAVVAADLARGHADASHWGSLDSTCSRCVELAADLGIDLT